MDRFSCHRSVKLVFASLGLFALTIPFAGCPKGVPQSTLQKAATASEQASMVLHTFQQSEILAYNQSKTCLIAHSDGTGCIVISDDDHLFIQQSLQSIFRIDKSVNTCIGGAETTPGVIACVDQALVTIDQLQTAGQLRIKSDSAKQSYGVAMAGAKGALTVVKTLLGGN